MIFERTATFQIEAPNIHAADAIWESDGPECGSRCEVVDVGELIDPEDPNRDPSYPKPRRT